MTSMEMEMEMEGSSWKETGGRPDRDAFPVSNLISETDTADGATDGWIPSPVAADVM